MRDKAYRRHQAKRYEEKYRKVVERFDHYNENTTYVFNGKKMRGEEGYNAFIDYQAKHMRTTAKCCSCYLCTVSTKRDGYSIADKRRLAHGVDEEEE